MGYDFMRRFYRAVRAIDIEGLPEASRARAAERIRRDFWKTGTISGRDVRLVFGDISETVSSGKGYGKEER